MRAAVMACLGLLAGVATATAVEHDKNAVGWCRLSDPPDCFISEHPAAQAQYRQRCADNPEHCTFKANGTISRWWPPRSIKPSPYPSAQNYLQRVTDPSVSEYFRFSADAVQPPEMQPPWPSIASATTADSDVTSCRMSDPAVCSISSNPRTQARFVDLCREAPDNCKFRADGTILQWVGHPTIRGRTVEYRNIPVVVPDPVTRELRNRAGDALPGLRAPQDVFGGER
jgi:hypothetical protein